MKSALGAERAARGPSKYSRVRPGGDANPLNDSSYIQARLR